MDGQPPTVTNQDNKDAPADLVVLPLTLKKYRQYQINAIIALDWYIPCRVAHPGEQRTILVPWSQLQRHTRTDPQAPADYGLDPLKAVEYVPRDRRTAQPEEFETT